MEIYEVFLACRPICTYYGPCGDGYLIPARVTEECYKLLGENDFLLTEEEINKVVKHYHLVSTARAWCTGGNEGWEFDELLPYMAAIIPAAEVRGW